MVQKPIPYGRQSITQEDIDEVVKVLQSDFLTQGPKIPEFESLFSDYIGAKYSVAVANGTAALHLAALALNLNKGDKVITTPITFAASANCVLYAGGEVDFVDIDPESYLIDLNQVEDKLKKSKPGTYKCIIPVDFAGYPVRLDKLKELTDKYNCKIIEDACHAPGGYFIDSKGVKQNCGNNNYSDMAIFSFHPVKHIATGEGGMITTNDEQIYKKLTLLRTHGITKDTGLLNENHGGWYYEMVDLGFNYRLTEIQAALGVSQLKKAEKGLKRRTEIALEYSQSFKNSHITTPKVDENLLHAYHLYVVLVEKRAELYNFLAKNSIFSQVHYVPVHLHPYYQKMGWKKGDLPIAENYYNQCLSLPMYPALSNEQQEFVIEKVKEFVNG